MNCERYRALLSCVLDGEGSAEDREALRQHEAVCPDCARLRVEWESLQNGLDSLCAAVPPLPEECHQRWVSRVEEEAEAMNDQKERKPFRRAQWTRALSIAAALVFVVGGTLLTRDSLLQTAKSPQLTAASVKDTPVETESWDDGAAAGGGMVGYAMQSSMTRAVANDAAMPMAEAEEAKESGAQESKIIRTASLTLATQEYDTALESLRALCKEMQGYESWSSESTSSATGLRSINLTLRIPAASLDAFLQGTAAAGRVTYRSETMDDVTDSYYDTRARLETQQALMARLQSLVTDAANLADILELESKIADTQYQIDRLTSSLATTDKRVNYATVDLTLREESPANQLTSDIPWSKRLQSALQAGVSAFVSFLQDASVFLVAALPFLAIVAIVAIIIRKRRKR